MAGELDKLNDHGKPPTYSPGPLFCLLHRGVELNGRFQAFPVPTTLKAMALQARERMEKGDKNSCLDA
jgi:hypothetical protein